VSEETQQPEQTGSPGEPTPGGEHGPVDGHRDHVVGRNGDGRPKADPILTRRFEALEQALHCRRADRRRRALNWSGVDETAVTFRSIEGQLEFPPDRPTSDLPDGPAVARSGD
jgi:hypothetical protein